MVLSVVLAVKVDKICDNLPEGSDLADTHLPSLPLIEILVDEFSFNDAGFLRRLSWVNVSSFCSLSSFQQNMNATT